MLRRIYRMSCPWTTVSAVLLLAVALTGCVESGPDRAAISGQVTIGGQPLKAGRILFTPLAPTEGPASSAAIVDGNYRLDEQQGPLVGQHRVAVEAALDLGFPLDDEQAFAAQAAGRPLPPSPIPPEYGSHTQVVAEVKSGEQNKFDVPIPAPPHSAARPAY